MYFGAAENLYYLLGLAALLPLVFVLKKRGRETMLRLFGKRRARELVRGLEPRRETIKAWSFALAMLLLVVAAARPQFGSRVEEVKSRGLSMAVLLDVSPSMLAGDMAPSRLEAVKREVREMLRELRGDRVALVPFSGTAFISCPLTTDYAAFRDYLEAAHPREMPLAGTALARALEKGLTALKAASGGARVVLLLSDGEDQLGEAMAVAERLKKDGIKLFAVGLGTARGELVPVYDGNGRPAGYKKDKDGHVVMSRLDESLLSRLATDTGGRYYNLKLQPEALRRVLDDLAGEERQEGKERFRTVRQERFAWFAGLALVLGLVGFVLPRSVRNGDGATGRRGEAGSPVRRFADSPAREGERIGLLLLITLAITAGGYKSAYENNAAVKEYGLGARAEAKGNSLLAREHYHESLGGFKDAAIEEPDSSRLQFNQGTAYYKSGDLKNAAKKFESAAVDEKLRAHSYYNLGNTRLMGQDFSGAVKAYRESLRLDAERKETWHNLEVAARLLEAQKSESAKRRDGESEQEKKNDASKQLGGQGEEEKKNQGEPAQGQDGEEKQNEGKQAGTMSKEEAEQMLEALAEMELKALGGPRDAGAGGGDANMNDW